MLCLTLSLSDNLVRGKEGTYLVVEGLSFARIPHFHVQLCQVVACRSNMPIILSKPLPGLLQSTFQISFGLISIPLQSNWILATQEATLTGCEAEAIRNLPCGRFHCLNLCTVSIEQLTCSRRRRAPVPFPLHMLFPSAAREAQRHLQVLPTLQLRSCQINSTSPSVIQYLLLTTIKSSNCCWGSLGR